MATLWYPPPIFSSQHYHHHEVLCALQLWVNMVFTLNDSSWCLGYFVHLGLVLLHFPYFLSVSLSQEFSNTSYFLYIIFLDLIPNNFFIHCSCHSKIKLFEFRKLSIWITVIWSHTHTHTHTHHTRTQHCYTWNKLFIILPSRLGQ